MEDFKLKFIANFITDNRWKYFTNGLGTTYVVSFFAVILGVVIGVLIALGAGPVLSLFQQKYTFVYSVTSIVYAFLSSTAIGVVFGYLPARSASKLDPVVALSR